MSVRGTLGGVLASIVVLVVGWQVGAAALDRPATASATSGSSGSSGTSGSSTGTTSGGTGSAGTTGSGGSSSSLKDGSYTGQAVQTPYGTVQVAVTVSGGRITGVSTPQLQAYDGRSQRINSQAVPILKQEVLQAQSAKVSMVSGATYTSNGYLTSLQSALDQAS